MIKRFLLPLVASVALAILIAGCGEDEPSDTSTPAPTSPPASMGGPQPQPTPAQALDEDVTEPEDGVTEIAAQDIAFAGNNIRMAAGEAVVIRVTNEGEAVHNLRIAGADGVFETEDDAVTEPAEIGPRGVGEVTFAPSLPGAYTFRCDFHSTMGGQITAE
jgi:plastocyanin